MNSMHSWKIINLSKGFTVYILLILVGIYELVLAGNQGHHQNFDPSLLPQTDFHGDEAKQNNKKSFDSKDGSDLIIILVFQPKIIKGKHFYPECILCISFGL